MVFARRPTNTTNVNRKQIVPPLFRKHVLFSGVPIATFVPPTRTASRTVGVMTTLTIAPVTMDTTNRIGNTNVSHSKLLLRAKTILFVQRIRIACHTEHVTIPLMIVNAIMAFTNHPRAKSSAFPSLRLLSIHRHQPLLHAKMTLFVQRILIAYQIVHVTILSKIVNATMDFSNLHRAK